MSRRRWVYRDDGKGGVDVVEVGEDYSATPVHTGDGLKFELEGVRGMHGEAFLSRGSFDRYLSQNGLALHSDMKGHLEKKTAERAQAFTPGAGYDAKQRREDVGRAMYQLQEKGRRK